MRYQVCHVKATLFKKMRIEGYERDSSRAKCRPAPACQILLMDNTGSNIRLIVEQCLEGNRKAEYKLFELYYGYVFSITLRYSNSREDAEEVCEEVFIKIFRNLDKYDPDCPFRPWLRRIVVNTAIDYIRKHQKHNNQHIIELAHAPEAASVSNTALSDIGYEELLACIQELPPAYRAVFLLYAVEGYKHHEIAEQLGISVGASKSNLAKARKKLQRLVCKKNGDMKACMDR